MALLWASEAALDVAEDAAPEYADFMSCAFALFAALALSKSMTDWHALTAFEYSAAADFSPFAASAKP